MSIEISERERSLLDPEELESGVRIVFDDMVLQVSDGVVEVTGEDGSTAYRWRCTVCGYVHEAPEPPRWCPLCGADADMFVREDVA